MSNYLTVKQAAETLGVSPKTIRRWITRGQLPAEKIGPYNRKAKQDNRPIRIPTANLKKMTEPKGNWK